MKAVWVSYLDLPKYIKGCSANQFRANMASIFSKMVDMGLNTVIMQVRPYADALYESDYFFVDMEDRPNKLPKNPSKRLKDGSKKVILSINSPLGGSDKNGIVPPILL